MAKSKVLAVADQKGDVRKSTSVYNFGTGCALCGKKVFLVDVNPQSDLTKMLGQCRPHEVPLTRANMLNNVVADTEPDAHPEILLHAEGFG